MGYDIDQSIEISAPPEKVWEWTVADTEKEARWRNLKGNGVQRVDRLDDGKAEVGSRFRGTVKIGPGEPQAYTNVVTDLEEHRRIAWKTEEADGPLLGHGEYVLTPTESGTRFDIRLAYPPRTFVGRIQKPIVKLIGRNYFIPRMLEKLKRLVEADATDV